MNARERLERNHRRGAGVGADRGPRSKIAFTDAPRNRSPACPGQNLASSRTRLFALLLLLRGLSARKSGDECGAPLPNCSRERPVARTPPRASDAILAPGFAEDHVGRRRDRGRSARRGARAGAPRDPRENPTRFILSVTSRARRVFSSSRASLTDPPPPRLASPRRLALPPSALAHALSAPPSPSRIRASSRSTSSTRASPRTRRTTRITPSAASSSTSRVPRSSR